MKQVYQADDGTIFPTAKEAQAHDDKGKTALELKISKYLDRVRTRGYGKESSYKPNDVCTWEVLGEDPNCDLGGSHYQPKLGILECSYIEAVKWACDQPNFFAWGSGGDINKVNIIKL